MSAHRSTVVHLIAMSSVTGWTWAECALVRRLRPPGHPGMTTDPQAVTCKVCRRKIAERQRPHGPDCDPVECDHGLIEACAQHWVPWEQEGTHLNECPRWQAWYELFPERFACEVVS